MTPPRGIRRRVLPGDEPTFEEQTAAQLRTLWTVLVAVAVAVTIVTGLAAYGFVRADNATIQAALTARAQSQLAQQVAAAALQSANEIKTNRDAYVLSACRDQNRRHRNTMRVFQRGARREHLGRRASAVRLKAFELILDAAIPYRSCRQSVARASGK